jgi:hypothetical protein
MDNKDNLKAKLQKIFEAPIADVDMPDTHYLNKDREFRAANKNAAPLIKQVQEYINNMSWTEIQFQDGNTGIVILPAALKAIMGKLYEADPEYCKPLDINGAGRRATNASEKALYNKIAHMNFSTVNIDPNNPISTNVSNLYVFKDVPGTGSRYYIHMSGGTGQRTHFPDDGINKGLKGLGQKLYRSLIGRSGWVYTQSNGTAIKNLMWDSLTDFKYKPDGTRDTFNEVYSFRFGGSLYALDTQQPIERLVEYGYTILNKITDKNKLASKELRKSNSIAVDLDYIEHIKAKLEDMPRSSKAKAMEMIDWISPDPARAAERARLQRQAAEEEANRRNEAIAARLHAFCGVNRIQDLQTNWQIGDWIVLRQFLVENHDDIKVRKVVKKVGDTYSALKNTDLPAFNANNGALNDVRNCTEAQRNTWVKALPPAVGKNLPPGAYGIPTNAPREAATGTATTNAPVTPNATATVPQNVTNIQSLFTTAADIATTYNFELPARKRFLTRRVENNYIYVTTAIPADCKINGAPTFAYFVNGENVKTMFNSKTMEEVRLSPASWASVAPQLVRYKRTPLLDKRDLSPGNYVFIKQHAKYFGYIAQVLSTSLTGRGDKYVYLRVPGAGTSNRLTLTPVALDKMTLAPNESNDKGYSKLFGKVFENYLDEIKTDLFNNDTLKEFCTNKNIELIDYVCELAINNRINESYAELNETFFDNLKQRFDKAKDVVSNLSDKAKDALQAIVSKAKDILSFIGSIKDIITNAAKDIFNNTFNKIKAKLQSDKSFKQKTEELLSKNKNGLVSELKTAKDVVVFYKTKFVTAISTQIENALKSLLGKEDLPVVPTTESLILEGENNVISKLLGNISHIPPFSWLHEVAHAGQKAANTVIKTLSNLTEKIGGPSFTLPTIAVLLGIAFEINVKGLVKGGLLNMVATYSVPFLGIIINTLGVIATFLATISIIDSIAGTNIGGGKHEEHGGEHGTQAAPAH